MMEHKGYIGRVEFDADAGLFHGEVINTRDVITFQGESVSELNRAFADSIEDYLAFCAERGEHPDKPFSGHFATRVSPDLHRRISLAAKIADMSLNAWVIEQLRVGVEARENQTARKNLRKKSNPKRIAKSN